MASDRKVERIYVIYRGVGRAGRVVEVHLVAASGSESVADAWARLSQLDPGMDPRSLEVETRPQRRARAAPRRRRSKPAPPIDFATWLAARGAVQHHARL